MSEVNETHPQEKHGKKMNKGGQKACRLIFSALICGIYTAPPQCGVCYILWYLKLGLLKS
jgi:hypothetical protein